MGPFIHQIANWRRTRQTLTKYLGCIPASKWIITINMVHNPLTVLSGARGFMNSGGLTFCGQRRAWVLRTRLSFTFWRPQESIWMELTGLIIAQQSNKPQKIQTIFPVGGFEIDIFTLNRSGVILLFGLSPTGRPSPNVCLISSWLPPGRCRVKWRSVRMDNSFWILALSSSSWQKAAEHSLQHSEASTLAPLAGLV